MADDYELALSLQQSFYDSGTFSGVTKSKINNPMNQNNELDQSLDYALALSLQEESEQELVVIKKKEIHKEIHDPSTNDDWNPKKIVDSNWELTDPNPNVHDLFVKFDVMFFNNILVNRGVAVTWSKKMTL